MHPVHIDLDLLREAGLAKLPLDSRKLVLDWFRDQLKRRVHAHLMQRMTLRQQHEYEFLARMGNESMSTAWLDCELPFHRDVVRTEFDLLRMELRCQAPAIYAIETLLADSATAFELHLEALECLDD